MPLIRSFRGWDPHPIRMIPAPAERRASRNDSPSSSVIVCSAAPARSSAFRTAALPFTECDQYGDRQPLESAFPVGPFSAEYRLGIQRRASRRLPHRLLTRHISPIGTGPLSTPAFHPVLSRS